jgi:hypothetical protein
LDVRHGSSRNCGLPFQPTFGANMAEIIRFVSKSERERARLIREARAIYDSIFPRADPASEKLNKGPVNHTLGRTNAYRSEGGLVS